MWRLLLSTTYPTSNSNKQRTLYTVMNMFKLSLLLFIIFVSCKNTNDSHKQSGNLNAENNIPKEQAIDFNTVIKGTGSPTIIFESGLGTPLNNWAEIQTSISTNYKTITYDRKGLGGSPATDQPRTLDNLVNDLNSLITHNKIEGPIILVGHSIGGHIVRKYQQTYKSNVVGMFLIDPTNEYIYEEVFAQMSTESADSMKTAWDKNYKKGSIGVYNEWKEAYTIDKIMRNYPMPNDIPITILASYQESTFLTKRNAKIKKEQFSKWKKDKPNIKIINTTNSGHYIHLGEPEWVVTELDKYLEDIK